MAQSNDFTSKVTIGRQVNFSQNLFHVWNTIFICNDMELDGDCTVNQNPFQGFDVAAKQKMKLKNWRIFQFFQTYSVEAMGLTSKNGMAMTTFMLTPVGK